MRLAARICSDCSSAKRDAQLFDVDGAGGDLDDGVRRLVLLPLFNASAMRRYGSASRRHGRRWTARWLQQRSRYSPPPMSAGNP